MAADRIALDQGLRPGVVSRESKSLSRDVLFLPPIAEIDRCFRNVRFVQIADIALLV